MSNSDIEPKVRELESNLLDVRHRAFPLMQRSQETGVIHLLKTYCDVVRDFRDPSLKKFKFDSLRTVALTLQCGLEYALKWVLAECQSSKTQPNEHWSVLGNEALSLLDWGKTYGLICSDHIAWSRGLLDVDVDEIAKTVTFHHKDDVDPLNQVAQFRSDSLVTDDFLSSIPNELLENVYAKWSAGADFSNPKNLIDPLESLKAERGCVEKLREWALDYVLPELDGGVSLGGISLNEFRSLYGPLFGICELYSRFERESDDREVDVGSFVLNDSLESFCGYLGAVGEVDDSKAREFVSLLTSEPDNRRSKFVSQPFVLSGEKHLCLAPQIFASLQPYHVLTGALLAANKKCYETVVEEIERANVELLAELFRSFGFQVETHVTIKLRDGGRMTPDLLVRELTTDRMLIADYKHVAPARYAGEVANKIAEHKKWMKQVRRYRSEFKADRGAQDRIFTELTTHDQVAAGLIYRWPLPLPLPIEIEDDVTFMDSVTLGAIRRGNDAVMLGDLLEYFRSGRSKSEPSDFRHDFVELPVDDWTYRHPVFVA